MTWTILFTPYGARLKEMRRLLHQEFGQYSIDQYKAFQVTACRELLKKLAQSPKGFMQDIRLCVFLTVFSYS